MLRDPACALLFECLDLVSCGAIQFFARDVIVDLGGTFAVRSVGAADVLGVGHPGRTLFPGIAAVAAEGPTLTITGRTVSERLTITVTAGGAIATVTERLAITIATERTTLAITGRTVTERLAISTIVVEGAAVIAITTRTIEVPRATLWAVTERLTITVTTERTTLAITSRTVTERLTITVTTERTTLAITSRTVTERLTITVTTEGTTLAITSRTVTERLTITVTTEGTTLTITSRTITERLTITVTTEGTTLTITSRTITERLTITVTTEGTTLTITSRTITERLTISTIVVERTTLAITSRTIVVVPVFPGTESARISAGVIVRAVRTAFVPVPAEVSAIAAAIAAVVLSHGGFLLLRADHWRVRSRS
ncbi:hypothetical protein [Paenarthrobacter histidinolovorans]|uniref:hypothetical protein n=1 Tax=Paenarthrobacter histidinolovorans TaxID=43664 RepID=UPI00384CEEA7